MELTLSIVQCALCKTRIVVNKVNVVNKDDTSYVLRYHSALSNKEHNVYTCSEECYSYIQAFLLKPDMQKYFTLL